MSAFPGRGFRDTLQAHPCALGCGRPWPQTVPKTSSRKRAHSRVFRCRDNHFVRVGVRLNGAQLYQPPTDTEGGGSGSDIFLRARNVESRKAVQGNDEPKAFSGASAARDGGSRAHRDVLVASPEKAFGSSFPSNQLTRNPN